MRALVRVAGQLNVLPRNVDEERCDSLEYRMFLYANSYMYISRIFGGTAMCLQVSRVCRRACACAAVRF